MQKFLIFGCDPLENKFWGVEKRTCAPETFAWALVMIGTIFAQSW